MIQGGFKNGDDERAGMCLDRQPPRALRPFWRRLRLAVLVRYGLNPQQPDFDLTSLARAAYA